jgi:hypothetical protein
VTRVVRGRARGHARHAREAPRWSTRPLDDAAAGVGGAERGRLSCAAPGFLLGPLACAGGSCRRTRPQTPQAPSEGRVPRHPPDHRPCRVGRRRWRRSASVYCLRGRSSCAESVRRCSRRRIARPWSDSALASQRCAGASSERQEATLGASWLTADVRRCFHHRGSGSRQPPSFPLLGLRCPWQITVSRGGDDGVRPSGAEWSACGRARARAARRAS